MGSKSKIAEKIIAFLPQANTLVDLFGGGGAIADCASKSGKWQQVIYNELEPLISQGFSQAINGGYANEKRWISRSDFMQLKNTDPYAAICYSFGNNLKGYLYSPTNEANKKAVFEMIVNDPAYAKDKVGVRRKYSKKYLASYKVPTVENLARLERMQAIGNRQNATPIQVLNQDYQQVAIPAGAVIYCDIPYKDTCSYKTAFDYDRFYQWALQQDNIYISSYEMPADKFKCVWECNKRCLLAPTSNQTIRKERIFVPIKPTGNEHQETKDT